MTPILSYLRMNVRFFKGIGNRMKIAYACDSMCMCVEFRDEILIRGEECKTREKNQFF